MNKISFMLMAVMVLVFVFTPLLEAIEHGFNSAGDFYEIEQ